MKDQNLAIPAYLEKYYWWAYVRPWAVRVFERQWLINLILYGNYKKLQEAALAEFESGLSGRTLKISCCYGSLTPAIAARVAHAGGTFDLVDITPAQLENARRKVGKNPAVTMHRMNATALEFPDHSFDNVLLFFLLHEEPQEVREQTMTEALRVLKPEGKLVIVDFGKVARWHPFRYLWLPFLGILEPFAVPMWRKELQDILPVQMSKRTWKKESYFGGLFQKLVSK